MQSIEAAEAGDPADAAAARTGVVGAAAADDDDDTAAGVRALLAAVAAMGPTVFGRSRTRSSIPK